MADVGSEGNVRLASVHQLLRAFTPIMRPSTARRRFFAVMVVLACTATTVTGADAPLSEFTKNWNGRRVVVKSPLYSVLYDEVGRTGIHYRGKLAGLTVATLAGQYYEFDGPGSDEDIVESTPNRVVSEMSVRFNRSDSLDIGTVKTITPLLLRQYDPGVVLIVESVRVDRSRVRLGFRRADQAGNDFATSLTVEWPAPFSKEFGEREKIETALRRFVEPVQLPR